MQTTMKPYQTKLLWLGIWFGVLHLVLLFTVNTIVGVPLAPYGTGMTWFSDFFAAIENFFKPFAVAYTVLWNNVLISVVFIAFFNVFYYKTEPNDIDLFSKYVIIMMCIYMGIGTALLLLLNIQRISGMILLPLLLFNSNSLVLFCITKTRIKKKYPINKSRYANSVSLF